MSTVWLPPLPSDMINACYLVTITLTVFRNHDTGDFTPFDPNPYLITYLITVTLCYPKHLFPRCNSDEGCLRWRKARTYFGIPRYACETYSSGWQQPNHIHSGGFITIAFRNIFGAGGGLWSTCTFTNSYLVNSYFFNSAPY